ncbi:MAG TPA: NAD(P)/FAD-dependent oxidoreductase, partial [Acidimicrobiales bacterium]|nr:NAD(P)/FAD-dependent oxidoreductase [Acidimicrobiales bacterium]
MSASHGSGSPDVIVVGARAAGAATAMLLARQGVRTLLLDRGHPMSDPLSTHALLRGGVLQLRRWGLLDDVIAAGTPPVRRSTFRFGSDVRVISLRPSGGVDALYAPRRTVLDRLLVRAAIDAGADVRYGTSVTNVMLRGGRVVGVRADGHDASELRASLVIGADGVGSTIAERVQAKSTRVGRHLSAMTYGYWSDLETDGYEWTFRPNACSGIIPTSGGEACVFAAGSPGRIGIGGVGLIEDVIAEGAPDLAARLSKATPRAFARTWTGHRGYIRQSWGPGWALVGDAACLTDPIGVHGLTDAFRDAELLARAVAGALSSDGSMDDALDDYQSTRDRLSEPLFDVVDRIASHEWDDAEIARLMSTLTSALADEVEAISSLEAS